MIRYLLSKIGCLLVIVGSIVLVVGIAAVQSGQPGLTPLFFGLVLSLLGLFFWNRFRLKGRHSTRFSLFRKKDRRKEQKKEEEDGWDNRYYD